jgi:hypothetical protein
VPGAREGNGDLPGADIVAGTAVVGQVLGILRDPLSQRVTRLITRYGAGYGRQVAVAIEWIVRRGPRRLVLGVGTRSMDDLPHYVLAPQPSRPGGWRELKEAVHDC